MDNSARLAYDWATLPWLPAVAFVAAWGAWLGVAAMWMELFGCLNA